MPRIPANLTLAATPIPIPSPPQDVGGDRAAIAAAAPRLALLEGIGGLMGQAQDYALQYMEDKKDEEHAADLSAGMAEYGARLEKLDFEIERKRASGTLGDLEKEYSEGLTRLDQDFSGWMQSVSPQGIKRIRSEDTARELKARALAMRTGHATSATLRILSAREAESANRFDLARKTAVSTGNLDAVSAAYGPMRDSNSMDPQLLSQMEAADRSAAEQNDVGRRLVGIQAASIDGYGLDDAEALSALESEVADPARYPSLTQEQRDRAKLDISETRETIAAEGKFSMAKFREGQALQESAADAQWWEAGKTGKWSREEAKRIAVDGAQYQRFLNQMTTDAEIATRAAEEAKIAKTKQLSEEEKIAKVTLEKSQTAAYIDHTNKAFQAATPLDRVNLFEEVQRDAREGKISESQYDKLRSTLQGDISAVQRVALGDILNELQGVAALDARGRPLDDEDDSELHIFAGKERERIDSPAEWGAVTEALTTFVQANPDAGAPEIREFWAGVSGQKKNAVLEKIWKQDAAATIRERARQLRNMPKVVSDDRTEDRMGAWQSSTQGAHMAPGGAFSGKPPLPATRQQSTIPTPTPAPVRVTVP